MTASLAPVVPKFRQELRRVVISLVSLLTLGTNSVAIQVADYE